MSADERRQSILEAAVEQYGEAGIHEVSTEAIAEAAGVSQPYIFRLFGTKTNLICEGIRFQGERVQAAFKDAVDNRGDAQPLDAMAAAYARFQEEDPNSLRCQLHTWAATSDPEIAQASRESYLAIWNLALELSQAPAEEVLDFFAYGMLLTVVAALDIPEIFDGIPILPYLGPQES